MASMLGDGRQSAPRARRSEKEERKSVRTTSPPEDARTRPARQQEGGRHEVHEAYVAANVRRRGRSSASTGPALAQSAAEPRGSGSEEICRLDHHHRLGSGPSGPRPAELLRPEMGAAHRYQGQGRSRSQTADMFTKIMQEFRARTGAYDALNVIPAWMPDLANTGALEVLDPYRRQVRLPGTSCADRADLSRQPDAREREDIRTSR